MTDPSNEPVQTTLKALMHGAFSQWHGLPEDTSVADIADLYGTAPESKSGRLAGHWSTYQDFPATGTLPDARIWSREGRVVRIDLEKPRFDNVPAKLEPLGEPDKTRIPPTGYRYEGEDELLEWLYPARGLVLHVSDPTLPGGTPMRRIVRVRAFTPMPVADYDRDLGGQQPRRIRRPNR